MGSAVSYAIAVHKVFESQLQTYLFINDFHHIKVDFKK